jgi:DNA-binding MarR family transcriptional regulator
MKLKNHLFRDLGSVCRCIQSTIDVRFRNSGLQRGQFIFLTRICETPGIRQGELAAACSLDKGTTAKAVQKLEDSGFIQRLHDENDRRAWNLFPTAKGTELYQKLIHEENREISAGLRGFSRAEAEQLQQMAVRLQNNIRCDWLETGREFARRSRLSGRNAAAKPARHADADGQAAASDSRQQAELAESPGDDDASCAE